MVYYPSQKISVAYVVYLLSSSSLPDSQQWAISEVHSGLFVERQTNFSAWESGLMMSFDVVSIRSVAGPCRVIGRHTFLLSSRLTRCVKDKPGPTRSNSLAPLVQFSLGSTSLAGLQPSAPPLPPSALQVFPIRSCLPAVQSLQTPLCSMSRTGCLLILLY